MKTQNTKMRFLFLALTLCFSAMAAGAQTTTFTYQGRLTDSSVPQPTSGTYEMQFKAFDTVAGNNQLDATIVKTAVQVVNGIFTVTLDYSATTFREADVYLEIGVRPAGSLNPFVILNPRQQFISAPLAI